MISWSLLHEPVATVPEALAALRSHAGKKVQVKVIRDTQTIPLEVQLNPVL